MPLSCITCGTVLSDDADYCPSCGRAIIRRFAGDPLGPDAALKPSEKVAVQHPIVESPSMSAPPEQMSEKQAPVRQAPAPAMQASSLASDPESSKQNAPSEIR